MMSDFPVRECRYRQGRTGRMDKMGPARQHDRYDYATLLRH